MDEKGTRQNLNQFDDNFIVFEIKHDSNGYMPFKQRNKTANYCQKDFPENILLQTNTETHVYDWKLRGQQMRMRHHVADSSHYTQHSNHKSHEL